MFTRTMFPAPPSREDELKASDFTALSLRSDIQASQQSYIPSQVANKVQSTGFPFTRNSASPMKVKRKRCLDGAELTIGIGSSSNLFKMQGVDHPTEPVSCVSLGGDYSQKQPAPTAAVSGFVKTSEKRVFDGASPYHHQFVQGVRGGNANKESDDRRHMNYPNRACLYQQYGRGISCENDGKMNTHPRARKAPGKSSFSDKIQHRMIKNRESAARSRARKQALEAQQQVENTELKKENELLKRVVRVISLGYIKDKTHEAASTFKEFLSTLINDTQESSCHGANGPGPAEKGTCFAPGFKPHHVYLSLRDALPAHRICRMLVGLKISCDACKLVQTLRL